MKASLLTTVDNVVQAFKPLDMFVSRVSRLLLPQTTAKACGTQWGSCGSYFYGYPCNYTCSNGKQYVWRYKMIKYYDHYGDCSVECPAGCQNQGQSGTC